MRVHLRPSDPGGSDADLMWWWRNENREFFGNPRSLTLFEHLCWARDTYGPYLNYAIYIAMAGTVPVGTVGCNQATGEIGNVLRGNKDVLYDGVMSRALRLVMLEYGSNRYWLRVLSTNEHAVRFYARLGFLPYMDSGDYTYMEAYQ